MQISSKKDPAQLLNGLIARELPDGGGVEAWSAFLRAQASLLRQMDGHLYAETGLGLGDFDVLAQLALAHGEMRMSELAEKALSSRSGMTRRIARLVDEGLVRRKKGGDDGRAVVVALTAKGVSRLTAIAPIHFRDIQALFVSQLDADELTVVERAMKKVGLDCDFG
jgi:DNA-binding MarR family transcriptional regulator